MRRMAEAASAEPDTDDIAWRRQPPQRRDSADDAVAEDWTDSPSTKAAGPGRAAAVAPAAGSRAADTTTRRRTERLVARRHFRWRPDEVREQRGRHEVRRSCRSGCADAASVRRRWRILGRSRRRRDEASCTCAPSAESTLTKDRRRRRTRCLEGQGEAAGTAPTAPRQTRRGHRAVERTTTTTTMRTAGDDFRTANTRHSWPREVTSRPRQVASTASSKGRCTSPASADRLPVTEDRRSCSGTTDPRRWRAGGQAVDGRRGTGAVQRRRLLTAAEGQQPRPSTAWRTVRLDHCSRGLAPATRALRSSCRRRLDGETATSDQTSAARVTPSSATGSANAGDLSPPTAF